VTFGGIEGRGASATVAHEQESPVCLGIPGRIVERSADHPHLASVDVDGVVRTINVAFLEDDPPANGDWVLIHLGFALERMTEDEAAGILALVEGLPA
jgi:hydrogenase expression/formation protein HypC